MCPLPSSVPKRRMLRTAATIVAVTLAVGVGALSASAAPRLPGSPSLAIGLSDDRAFLLGTETTRSSWLARAQALGSSAVRLGVGWSLIAPPSVPAGFRAADPRDPHYNWSSLDAAVRDATADGQTVVLTVSHAPRWAEGPNRPSYGAVLPGAWEPQARAFGQFAHALAIRFSGRFPDPLRPRAALPAVRFYQAWNEPNLPRYIMPQWYETSGGALTPASPRIYRALLNAFFFAVKSVRRSNVVLAAGTAPYGDPPGDPRDQMYPVLFYRELFCLTSDTRSCPSGPPHLDALDHHPYSLTPSAHAHNAGDISVPDLGKISAIVRAAQRIGHVLPGGPKPIWITEIDWATAPPITPGLQARFLALGFYVLWRQRVSHVFWYLIRDPVGQPNSFSAGGLYSTRGAPKPAVRAFRFPFVALAGSGRTVTVWGKAPRPGGVRIEAWRGGRWRRVLTVTTTADGIFFARPRLGHRLLLRARMGAAVSVPFATVGRI